MIVILHPGSSLDTDEGKAYEARLARAHEYNVSEEF